MISRRQFIAVSAMTAAGLAAIGGNLYFWWDAPPSSPFSRLAEREGAFLTALSSAAFPAGEEIDLDGGAARLDRFFDELLKSMPEDNVRLIKLLLQGLDRATMPFYGASFHSLSSQERQEQLSSWLSSDQHLLRSAVQSMVILLGMGYTTHPKVSPLLAVHHRCGFGQ
jgi:hypothetical protein